MKYGAKLGPLKHKLDEYFAVGGSKSTQKVRRSFKWQSFWTEEDTLQYLRQTRVLLSSIIRGLDELSIQPKKLYHEDSGFYGYRSQCSLPRIPEAWTRDSLTQFVREITKWRYVGDQRLSDPVGLISLVVRDIMRPTNERTINSLNPVAFNFAIEYFVRIRDLEQARQMVINMKSSLIIPNSDTMHHFLRSQAEAPAIMRGGHPCLRTISVLNEMKRYSLPASSLTWNLVLQGSPMGFGKSLVLEEMTKRSIPLDGRSLAMCLDIVCSRHGLERALEYALDQGRGLPVEAAILLVTKLLQNRRESTLQRARLAFKFLKHAIELQGVSPDLRLLNSMLESTWSFRRLEWQLGLVGYFKTEYGVDPDPETWEHILHTLTVLRKSSDFGIAAGMVLKLASYCILTPKARVWGRQIIRGVSGSKFQLRDPGVSFFNEICEELNWKKFDGPSQAKISWRTVDQWPLADFDPALFGPILRTDSPELVSSVLSALKTSPQEAYATLVAKWPKGIRTTKVI